ncbi:MAG: hypothetical protein NZ571_14320 [Anaerolineae bacterium]|nr:hypothetical protein [Anaerolineae bacterium]
MLESRPLSLTVSLLVLAFIIAATFIPVFHSFYDTNDLDYMHHHGFAKAIEGGEQLKIPHVLYHTVLIIVQNILGAQDTKQISTILLTIFRVLVGCSLLIAIKLQTPGQLTNALTVVAVALLLWTAPIYLWFNPPIFLGYINYLPYHNPTQNLMLIFVVPTSLIALRAIAPQPFKSVNQRVFFTLLSVLVVLLLSMSKPNYSIALLPALGLIVLYRFLRRLPIDWSLLIFGIGAPISLMLAVQYIVTYTDTQRASVGIGWLEFFRYYRTEDSEVFAKLALSAIFPVVVYGLHLRQVQRNDYLNLAWLVFGAGLVWSYLFYEQGERLSAGNFVWSAYAALFVLMFSTLLFLIKQYATKPFRLSWRLGLSIAAFLLHVCFGVYAAVRVVAAV